MTADPRFTDLLPDTVRLVERRLPNKYGEPTRMWQFTDEFTDEFGVEQVLYPCRIEDGHVRGGTTRDDGMSGRLFILGDAPIGMDDLLILPDDSTPIIRTVRHVRDEAGPHHTVVEFAR